MWTEEQQTAINKSGTNIIVSAGAGSGKTAVLTERVGRILKSGTHINELLVLTFTKDAAAEMKERIRSLIKETPSLNKELDYIDASYITTFDSFALSVVKKYHYLLNISNNIEITDDSIISIEKRNILRKVLDDNYQNQSFQNFINDFCNKNDQTIFDCILKISESINKLPNKYEYLDNYIDNFYNDNFYNEIESTYTNILKNAINRIKISIEEFKPLIDNDYYEKLNNSVNNLYKANTLEEIISLKSTTIPRTPNNSPEEIKEYKDKILKPEVDNFKKLCKYGLKEEIIKNILLTKDNAIVIINLLKEYYHELETYKKENLVYDFQDIALLAIEIVKNHKSAREELKNTFKEIMIDEYQDTNDIQETFITYIKNNNVYMVGDIKQSIYRFRNANPYIFKSKYDDYSKNIDGFKIDLLKNFRSRSEVLDDINLMFNPVMDDEIGGADYEATHQMNYGNTAYDNQKNNTSYNMNILTYDQTSSYKNHEIEAFTIAKDIKDKIDNNYQVFDKKTKQLRNITYNDFVVIADRSTHFGIYKKVFEYLYIPSSINKDEKLTNSIELSLIKNSLIIISAIKTGENYTKFKFAFTSLARSFIYELNDQEIFNNYLYNNFKESIIYQDMQSIAEDIYDTNLIQIIEKLISKIKYYQKVIKLNDPNSSLIRLNKTLDLIRNLSNKGYDINDTIKYLENLEEKGLDIKYKNKESITNAVSIMTTHGSKGLEYPICYFPSLYPKFNIKDLNDLIMHYNKYGIIIPYKDQEYGITNTVLDLIVKDDYLKEEISEKIRLFYVALTRAREQIILLLPNSKKQSQEIINDGIVSNTIRTKYLSLASIMYSINKYTKPYQNKINIEELQINKDYLYPNTSTKKLNTTKENITVNEINITNEIIKTTRFSKTIKKLITKEEQDNINLGLKFHQTLEFIDFKDYNIELIKDEFIREKITKFLNKPLLKDISEYQIYQELEFVHNDTHGIIDLILESEDKIHIIDYKLSNINDNSYIQQLNSYKNYIKTLTNKEIKIYLYSIINNELNEIGDINEQSAIYSEQQDKTY